MNELPRGWESVTMADISTTAEQVVPNAEDQFQYLDIGSIDREKKCIVAPQMLTGAEAPTRARKLVQSGDTLVSMTRPNLNAVALVPEELDGQIASTGFDVVRPLHIDPRWIFYAVRSRAFVEAMTSLVQGALYPAVKTKDVRSFPLAIAPLAEQKRIADKLDTVLARVDACRERLNHVPTILRDFRRSVLAAATSGRLTDDWRAKGAALGHDAAKELKLWQSQRTKTEKKPLAAPDTTHWKKETPTGWTVVSVNQFAECLDRLRVPIKREDRKSAQGLYPYYGANGEVSRIDEYIFDDELVLVTEDETFYGRDKPIAYRVSGKCWVNNHAHVLRASSPAANDYLCYALMYYDVIPWLSGTTGRAKLTQQALNTLPIAVPPEVELIEITRRVAILFAFADQLEVRLAKAKAAADCLTPAMLTKAFQGELVAQDPNDEPAAVLLERLAKERLGNGKATKGMRAKGAASAALSADEQTSVE